MAWLGHFEFGLDHKPFVFDAPPEGDPSNPLYWLDLWNKTYSGIAETAPEGTYFINFETFCNRPEDTKSELFEILNINCPLPHEVIKKISPQSMRSTDIALTDYELERAYKIYSQLSELAVNRNVS